MAQASLNLGALSEESSLRLEIIQLLESKDKDYLKVARDALLRDKMRDAMKNSGQKKVPPSSVQQALGVEEDDEELSDAGEENVQQSPVQQALGVEEDDEELSDAGEVNVQHSPVQQALGVEEDDEELSDAGGRRNSEEDVEYLEDMWSEKGGPSTIEWGSTVSGQRKGVSKAAITRSPAASSSGTSIVPPTPGLQRAYALIETMRLGKKKTPQAKKASAPTAPSLFRHSETKSTSVTKSTSAAALKRKANEKNCDQGPPKKKARETSPEKNIPNLYPCDLCGALRDRLDKHYINAHKMDQDAARARYRIQKSIVDGGKRVSTCPECGKVVAHLGHHLTNMHGIERKTEKSYKLRDQAKRLSIEDQLKIVEPKEIETTKTNGQTCTGIAIIKNFIKWLQTMRGKKTTEKSAKQHGSQATRMWRQLASQEQDDQPLQLRDITSDGILEFVELERLQMKPGTLRSYLCSFGFFLEFLNSSSCSQKELGKETLDVLLKEVTNYNSNLRGDVAQRKAEFALQEHEDLLPASIIHEYLQSSYLQDIELKIYKGEVFDSVTDYCAIRDALMAMIVCTNGQRTSAIKDIRPNNVFKAKLEEDMRVIGVACHKTSASRGVANISLTNQQYNMINQFAIQSSKAGEEMNRGDTEPIFVSFAGNKMSASNAAKSIRQALEKSGAMAKSKLQDAKFTATIVRKLITTLVREEEPEIAGPLAQQLNHSAATGEGSYQLKMSQKSSAKVVKMITSTITAAAIKEVQHTEATGATETANTDIRGSQSSDTTESENTETITESTGTESTHQEMATDSDTEEVFQLPAKPAFVEKMLTFANSKYSDRLLSQAFKLQEERKKDPVGTMVEGRRYELIEKFEAEVMKTYDFEFSKAFVSLVPQVSNDADLQSDMVILYTSEFANTFCIQPQDLNVRDRRQPMPLEELEEIFAVTPEPLTEEVPQQMAKNTATQSKEAAPSNTHKDTPTTSQTELQQQTENKASLNKKRTFWTKEDSNLLENIFQEELIHSIADKKRISKKTMKSKISLNQELEPLVEKYGETSIYEKLYSLVRPKFAAD